MPDTYSGAERLLMRITFLSVLFTSMKKHSKKNSSQVLNQLIVKNTGHRIFRKTLNFFWNRRSCFVKKSRNGQYSTVTEHMRKRQTMRLTLNETPLFYERRGFLHSSGSSDDQGIRSSNSAGSIFPCLSQRFGSSVRIYLK